MPGDPPPNIHDPALFVSPARSDDQVSEGQLGTSRDVLAETGNASSATVPPILERLVGRNQLSIGEYVVAMAIPSRTDRRRGGLAKRYACFRKPLLGR